MNLVCRLLLEKNMPKTEDRTVGEGHIYSGVDYVTFEGIKMPCMSGYDEYLRMVFGDYMQLPPVEDRVPHHDIAYLDLNSPCEIYDSKRKNKQK